MISQVAYNLSLPDKSCAHNVLHVSYLKKELGKHQSAQTTLPILDYEGRVILKPEGIISINEKKL